MRMIEIPHPSPALILVREHLSGVFIGVTQEMCALSLNLSYVLLYDIFSPIRAAMTVFAASSCSTLVFS